MIPKTYQQWYRCITEECGIPLTQAFIASRLAVLESQDHQETRRFVSLYGQPHLNSVVQWFKKAGKNCCKSAPFSLSYEGTRQMRVPSIHSSNQGSTGSE